MHFQDLPEDVLILIFQQCGINDIFSLRLTNRHFEQCITIYGKAILPASARVTIPEQEIARLYLLAGTDYSIAWLKRLIPRYLATTLLSGPTFRGSHILCDPNVIHSDNPCGDALRYRLQNGWRILRHLSNISRNVYWPPLQRLASTQNRDTWSTIQTSLSGKLGSRKDNIQDFDLIRRKEEMVLSRRRDFVQKMFHSDAADYMITIRLISKCFRYHPRLTQRPTQGRISSLDSQALPATPERTPKLYPWPGKEPGTKFQYEDFSTNQPCPIALWLIWFLMHTGPEALWTQWISADILCDHASDVAWSLWESQDRRTKALREHVADEIDLAIRRKCLKPAKQHLDDSAIREAARRATGDNGLFVRDAVLGNTLGYADWGEETYVLRDLEEEDFKHRGRMIGVGKHPKEKVPYFVFLGRGDEIPPYVAKKPFYGR